MMCVFLFPKKNMQTLHKRNKLSCVRNFGRGYYGDYIKSYSTPRNWPFLEVDSSKSPVNQAGNYFSRAAHLNAFSMETGFLSSWFYSLKCFPR